MNKTLQKIGYQKFSLLNTETCEKLIEWYKNNTPQHSFSGFYSTMFFDDANYRKAVDEVIKASLSKIICEYFEDYKILFANFIMKEAQTENKLDIHADWLYCDESKYQSYNLWINLNADENDMGVLSFIPASHKWKNPFRFTPYVKPTYFDFMSSLNNLLQAAPVKPGEAILYDGRILHASAPNMSKKNRLVINMVLLPKEADSVHLQKINDKFQLFKTNQHFYYHYKLDELVSDYAALLDDDYPHKMQCFGKGKLRINALKNLFLKQAK